MKVCCQVYCCRENTFLIFSFALSVKLFPPLVNIMKAWLIVCQYLYSFSLAKKNVADCSIFQRIIILKSIVQSDFPSGSSSFHQLINVSSAYCNRKKSYSCKYRVASSYIIRDNKLFIAFFVCNLFQGSASLVCCCIDSLCGALFAVFLFEDFFKYTESNRRLCGSTGFGDHVNREIPVSYYVDKPLDIAAADAVSNIVDLRCFADFSGNIIIKTMSQKLNCCSGSQIGTSNTDYKKDL